MTMFLELLSYPFVQRAIVVGALSAALMAMLGVFVVLRRMSFFSDGIAHASLAGVAAGILLSSQPLAWALVVSVLFAVGIYFLEKTTTLSVDSLIGILFTASLALGVVLINLKTGYQPELMSFLFGNILAIQTADVILVAAAAVAIGLFIALNYSKYILLSLNRELALLSGMSVRMMELALYVVLAMAVVLGVKLVGVILVSALLIIPVSAAKLFSRSSKMLLVLSIILAELIMAAGIGASLAWNIPTGAAIVLVGALLFFVMVGVSKLFK